MPASWGPKHDPWQVRQDPNRPGFGFEGLALPEGLSVERLDRRKSLLDQVGPPGRPDHRERDRAERPVRRAARAGLCPAAFGQGRAGVRPESAKTPGCATATAGIRTGSRCLLARRLVAAGVPIVQVNMGRVQNWDTHSAEFQVAQEPAAAAARPRRGGPARRPGSAGAARRNPGRRHRRIRAHAPHRLEHRQRQHPRRPRPLGGACSRPSSPAPAFAADRRSASPTGSEPTRPVAPTRRATWPPRSIARSASTRTTSCATAWAGRSGSAPAKNIAPLFDGGSRPA